MDDDHTPQEATVDFLLSRTGTQAGSVRYMCMYVLACCLAWSWKAWDVETTGDQA